MKLLSIAVIISFAIFYPGTAISQSQELLIPIDEDELAQVQVANDWFLKNYLYFAKRHRIVRVSRTALLSPDPITISLFPDAKISAQREQFKEVPDTTIRWVGKVVDPTARDFGLVFESDRQREAMIGPLTELRISGIFYDKDIATNESFVPNTEWSIKGYPRPTDPSRIEKAAHIAINAFVLSPLLDNVYKIQSLNATPEYHLVYEIDPAREYAHEPNADPILEAENAARREQHRAHKEAIGESPGVTWTQNVKASAAEAAKRGENN